MQTTWHYRFLALLLTIVMGFQIIVIPAQTVYAEGTATDVRQEENVHVSRNDALTVLAFTSDTHNTSSNTAANRLGLWLDIIADADHYGKNPDVMSFGGDMAGVNASGYWDLTQADMDKLTQRSVTGVYTTGNHEISNGGDFSFSSYLNGSYLPTETKGKFEISKEAVEGENYRIYCLGSRSSRSDYSNSIADLSAYLDNAGNDKPIFIITHFPLHAYGTRVTTGASNVIDVLNNAVENNGQKIVFLWGHNHTESDTYYDYIYRPGDTIPTGSNNSNRKTIDFYYGAAGCMSDREYGTGSASVKGKGLIVTINNSNLLSFAYYDENGNNVTEGGTFTEQDPIEVTGVTVSTSVTVDIGGKVQLTANVSPDDATNKAVRWSSNNTSVATVDEKGLVQGISEGSAIITVITVDGSYSANCEVTVTPNDDPHVEKTINITPATEKPEEYITINTGDTLVINVINGSSSSAYNYTATLDNSNVAQIQSNVTVNISAGGSGQFMLEGITAGTADITIQNDQSNSQYIRRGVIHLTVTDTGSTPVDPSEGKYVDITPSTDNPEEYITIATGDLFTISVTNGSSSNSYSFTATLDNSGIAQIQGNTIISIAAGNNGQFIVEGISAGTTDITIQNNPSNSQYVRKGIIHLTVEESGTTPVDPSLEETVTYRLITVLRDGRRYIITSGNSGNVYVLSTEANGSRTLKGIAATVAENQIILSASDAAKSSFTAELRNSGTDGFWMINESRFLSVNNASGLRMVESSEQNSSSNSVKFWHYKADGKDLLWNFKDTTSDGYTDASQSYKYYLVCSNGNFTDGHVSNVSLANSNNLQKIYIFAEMIDHEHAYAEPEWEWTINEDSSLEESEGVESVSAVAKFVCVECEETIEVIADNNSISKTVQNGKEIYTATIEGPDGKTYSSEKESVIEYTINYVLNEGTNPVSVPVSYTVESETVTLPIPHRSGYVFDGWFETASCDGEAVTVIEKGSTGDKVFYAQWRQICTVTFVLGNGSEDYTEEVLSGETVNEPAAPTREGYTFTGWYRGDEKYDFTKPVTDSITLTAGWEEIRYPVFTVHSLVLSGEIGVNMYMDLPEIEGVDYSKSYMEFTVDGKNGKTTVDTYDPDFKNQTGKYYGFTVHVNSVQMADTIHATFHYFKGEEELTVTHDYSVAEYLNTIKNGNYSDKMKALAKAIGDYGYYAQPYLANRNKWSIGTDHEEMPAGLEYTVYGEADYEEALRYVRENGLSVVRDPGESEIEKVTYALSLDAATGIYVYLKPKAGYEGEVTAVIDGGEENKAELQSDGRYRVFIEGISAHKLGQMYTVTVTAGSAFDVKVCALSYVETMLNSDTSSEALKNMVVSLYNYYEKAMDYRAG